MKKLHPSVRVDVQVGGSSRGISDVRAELVDIGMVSRKLKKTELDLLAHTIAYDGIAIILNTQNTVTKLSNMQVIGIYTGKITNWSQV